MLLTFSPQQAMTDTRVKIKVKDQLKTGGDDQLQYHAR